MQQISFTRNLIRKNNEGPNVNANTTFFVIEEGKEKTFHFSKGTVKIF